jgi:hypothetical protein
MKVLGWFCFLHPLISTGLLLHRRTAKAGKFTKCFLFIIFDFDFSPGRRKYDSKPTVLLCLKAWCGYKKKDNF